MADLIIKSNHDFLKDMRIRDKDILAGCTKPWEVSHIRYVYEQNRVSVFQDYIVPSICSTDRNLEICGKC